MNRLRFILVCMELGVDLSLLDDVDLDELGIMISDIEIFILGPSPAIPTKLFNGFQDSKYIKRCWLKDNCYYFVFDRKE